MNDFETVRDALSWSASTFPEAQGRREAGKVALDRIEVEVERLQRLVDEYDGPGYTYELNKLEAENERLRAELFLMNQHMHEDEAENERLRGHEAEDHRGEEEDHAEIARLREEIERLQKIISDASTPIGWITRPAKNWRHRD
jgi:predicted RNase H-like nuclease (RuvC/YqgF family)